MAARLYGGTLLDCLRGFRRGPSENKAVVRKHAAVPVLLLRNLVCVSVVTLAVLPVTVFADSDAAMAKSIFRKRCTACHTYGKGIKVGPDLKGVTDRRKRDWLVSFVRSSSSVIQSRDATATKLFREFKQERMPDWSDLSPQQVEAILDYFAAAGPEQKEPDERHATTASTGEIEAGRKLFHGMSVLTYGGRACNTCHHVNDTVSTASGSLGPDLTGAYWKYQDRALTDFLKRPCFGRDPEVTTHNYLTAQESFNLKAYLARAAGVEFSVLSPSTGSSDRSSSGKILSKEGKGGTQ